MSGDDSRDFCRVIDDDIVELRALNRLQEGPVRQHLDVCPRCAGRLAGKHALIEELKVALPRVDVREIVRRR